MSKNIDSSQKESNKFVHKQPPFIWASKKITQPFRPIKPDHASPTPSAGAAKEDDLVLPPTHQLLHRLPEKIFAAQWPQQLSNDFIGFGFHSLL